mgnify:CR=1 FL=1
MGKYSKFDKQIMSVALLVFLVSAYLISNPSLIDSFLDKKIKGHEIAIVLHSTNDVRRRHKKSFQWLSLDKKKAIIDGDSVFTGSDSTSEIKLHSGSRIRLSENSLVVLTENKKLKQMRFTIVC